MKKTLSICLLSILGILGLVGCNKQKEEETPVTTYTKPTITLSASKIDDVYVGEEITLPTATASDENDGDISNKVTINVKLPDQSSSTVTTGKYTPNVIGEYVVTYEVENTGKLKDSKSLSFSAKDYEAPVITYADDLANGAVGAEYTLPTPTVTDVHDTDLTATATVKDPNGVDVTVADGKFTPAEVGNYVVTYTVTNSHSKSATLTKTLTVASYSAPSFTVADLGEIYVDSEYTITLPTVTDEYDTDLTATVTVKDPDGQDVTVTDKKFTADKIGEYKLTFEATNSKDKTTTVVKTLTVKDGEIPAITLSSDTIGTMYVGQTLTIPSVTITDASDEQASYKVYLKDGENETEITSSTLTLTTAGTYSIVVKSTNKFSKTDEKTIEYTVKEKFVIAWDDLMYVNGTSALTPTIISNYETYIKANVDFGGATVEFVGITESDYSNIVAKIEEIDADIIIGFPYTLYQASGGNLSSIAKKSGSIAEVETRYISQQTDSTLAATVYASSITENGFSSLKVTEINIAWFDHAASTTANMEAVTTALTNYLTEKGYSGITINAKKYAKGSGSGTAAYLETKENIVNDYCVLGFNWGSNVNQSGGFQLTTVRKNDSALTFSSTGSRYVFCSIGKSNPSGYTFYSELFEFLTSETMIAAYATK